VVERPLFSPAERRVLEALARHRIPFMVVGLSAAVLHGAPVVTQDIDLWFKDLSDPKLSTALRTVGAGYVPPFEMRTPQLVGEGTELFDLVTHMHGLGTFRQEIGHALDYPLETEVIKVLSLERILASKRAANRPKDRLVIPVLENTLRTLQTRAMTQLPKTKKKPSSSSPKKHSR
jgi:hypothetical protein